VQRPTDLDVERRLRQQVLHNPLVHAPHQLLALGLRSRTAKNETVGSTGLLGQPACPGCAADSPFPPSAAAAKISSLFMPPHCRQSVPTASGSSRDQQLITTVDKCYVCASPPHPPHPPPHTHTHASTPPHPHTHPHLPHGG
jgi:hypothetical protein